MLSNLTIALRLLDAETNGDVQAALNHLDSEYRGIWVYRSPVSGELFPETPPIETPDFDTEMGSAYSMKARHYEIKSAAEQGDRVFIELIESYQDARTGGQFCTPLVLVLEFNNGKVRRTRHYCDPALSHRELTSAELSRIFE